MNFKENIYNNLPNYLQNVAIFFEAEKISKRRYSKEFFLSLESALRRDKFNKKQIDDYILKKLKKTLVIAYENTQFYKTYFDDYGFNPYSFNSLHELEIFPLQTKNIIKENIARIVNNSINKKKLIMSHTSGTTGSGFIFPETIESEHRKWAVWWRYRLNHNINIDFWASYFGGRNIVSVNSTKPPFWKIAYPLKQVMYSMYHLNKKNVKAYLDDMNKRKIKWIHGYPSTLSYLASMMLDIDYSLDYKTIITTGSENLLENQKELIRKAFGVIPVQHYGMSEPVANISECKYGRLHIDEDYSYVELLPVNDKKGLYKIVGTSFYNDALFFLRYDTCDIVTLSDNQSCECGRYGRIVDKIDGREEDFLTLDDGTKIGRLDHIFKDIENVAEARFHQGKSGIVTLEIVKGDKYSLKDERKIKKEIYSRVNLNSFKIRYTDKIEKTEAGKLRFVISECSVK